MGVPETLKRLGPLIKEANLWQGARGRVVGFDGHVFLHHFVYAAAADIINHGDYNPLAKMFRQRCQQIVGHGVNPIIVFDGDRLPAKHPTKAGMWLNAAQVLVIAPGMSHWRRRIFRSS